MKRKSGEIIAKMSVVALLSALGIVLMVYGEFPYIPAPWCKFDFSETVVLIAYALYGFSGALGVSLLKSLISLWIYFYQYGAAIGIGQVASFIADLCYIFGLFFFSHVLKWFLKGIGMRIVSYVLTTVFVSLVLTGMNALFITPSFAAQKWTTCFEPGLMDQIVSYYSAFGTSYFLIIVAIYLPFNLLKGLMCFGTYELIFNRLIFKVFPSNPFIAKYFLKASGKESKEANPSPSPVGDSSEPGVLEKVYSEEKKDK
jgi:riboflavin transporter FmnP